MRSYADAAAVRAEAMVRRSVARSTVAEDGLMLALACVLTLVESRLPAPAVGVRLGLGNAAVLVVLARGGFARAARVSMARVAVIAVAAGTLGGPAFLLSLAGACASLGAMAAASRSRSLSLCGVSVVGAFAHAAAQLAVVSTLVSSSAVAALATPVLLGSIPLGVVTGAVAGSLISRLEGGRAGR